MSKPFTVLKLEAGQKAQDTSTSLSTKIGNWMNQYYESLWKSYLWKEITIIDQSVTFTAGATEQLLPKNIDITLAITHRATNAVLSPASPYVYQIKYLSQLSAQADPLAYAIGGSVGVSSQPASTGIISLVSNSSSDSTVIRVYGTDSNGYNISETVTLTGISSKSTTKSFATVTDVVKNDRSIGEIIIKDSSGNTMDSISPMDYRNKYLKIHANAQVGTNTTFYVSGKKRFSPLINDQDVPAFECDNALIDFAVSEVLKIRGKFDQAGQMIMVAEKYIKDLVSDQEVLGESMDQGLPRIQSEGIDTYLHAGGGRW